MVHFGEHAIPVKTGHAADLRVLRRPSLFLPLPLPLSRGWLTPRPCLACRPPPGARRPLEVVQGGSGGGRRPSHSPHTALTQPSHSSHRKASLAGKHTAGFIKQQPPFSPPKKPSGDPTPWRSHRPPALPLSSLCRLEPPSARPPQRQDGISRWRRRLALGQLLPLVVVPGEGREGDGVPERAEGGG